MSADGIDQTAVGAGRRRAIEAMRGQRTEDPEPTPAPRPEPEVDTRGIPDWVRAYGPNPTSDARRRAKDRARERGLDGQALNDWMDAPNPYFDGRSPEQLIVAGEVDVLIDAIERSDWTQS